MVLSGLRECGQVLAFAGEGLKLALAVASAAAEIISALQQLMSWWWVQERSGAGFNGWQMGLCAMVDRSFVACFLIVFWLFFSAFFLLTLSFSKMKYPAYNCSQIVIIDCGQMVHRLWSSNRMKETDSSPRLCL